MRGCGIGTFAGRLPLWLLTVTHVRQIMSLWPVGAGRESRGVAIVSRRITEFEYADLGTDHAQYFPGVGVAGTRWENVYLGVGESAEEAMNDAAENAAQSCEWADIPSAQDGFSPVPDAHSGCEVNAPEHDECEWQHYVALFIR